MGLGVPISQPGQFILRGYDNGNHKSGFTHGYTFFCDPNDPTLGLLRLNTKGEPLFVSVTRGGLIRLAEALCECADELEDIQ